MKNPFKKKPTETEQLRNTIRKQVDEFKSTKYKLQSSCRPVFVNGKWDVIKTTY